MCSYFIEIFIKHIEIVSSIIVNYLSHKTMIEKSYNTRLKIELVVVIGLLDVVLSLSTENNFIVNPFSHYFEDLFDEEENSLQIKILIGQLIFSYLIFYSTRNKFLSNGYDFFVGANNDRPRV